MTDFIIALAATWWPVIVPVGLMVAYGLWLDRRWEVRANREAEARKTVTHILDGRLTDLERRNAAQAPRRRGQDMADPWGRPVYDPQRAVEFEVEHRARWES